MKPSTNTSTNWLRVLVMLIGLSVLLSTVVIRAVDTSMTAILIVSSVLLIVLGTSFLVGFWMATLSKGPDVKRTPTRDIQTERRFEYEMAELREQIMQRDRIIFLLKTNVRRMQEDSILLNTPPPPLGSLKATPPRHFGNSWATETRQTPAVRREGTYPAVNLYGYEEASGYHNGNGAGRTGPHPRIRVERTTATARHVPQAEIGTQPARVVKPKNPRQTPPKPKSLPGKVRPRSTRNGLYSTVNRHGHGSRVAKPVFRRNGNGHV